MFLEQLHHVDQHGVALGFNLGDCPACGLGVGAVDQALLEGLIPFGELQVSPRQFQCGVKLLDEIAHAARAAAHVVSQERAHEGPAHACRINNGIVNVAGGGNVLVQDMQRFAPQGFLQPVTDVTVNFLLEAQDLHAHLLEIGRGSVHRGAARLVAGHQFDQRQQIDGIERVADDHTLRVPGTL